jgi:glutaredoxin 3
MSSEVRSEIDRQIAENKILVYSKTWCPYCTRAKEAIAKLGVPFKAIELDVILSNL